MTVRSTYADVQRKVSRRIKRSMRKRRSSTVQALLNGVAYMVGSSLGHLTPYKAWFPEDAQRADYDALASDWAAVGEDLWAAIRQYNQQLKEDGTHHAK